MNVSPSTSSNLLRYKSKANLTIEIYVAPAIKHPSLVYYLILVVLSVELSIAYKTPQATNISPALCFPEQSNKLENGGKRERFTWLFTEMFQTYSISSEYGFNLATAVLFIGSEPDSTL